MSTDVASFMVTEMGQKGINNDKKKVKNRKENVCGCVWGGKAILGCPNFSKFRCLNAFLLPVDCLVEPHELHSPGSVETHHV